MRSLAYLLFALLASSLTGCANYVADQITHPQKSVGDIDGPSGAYVPLALQDHRDCQAPCLHYVSGKPFTAKTQTPTDNPRFSESRFADSFIFGADKNAHENHWHGTVILLHGYSANWSWMLGWSNYFQSLGFHTLMPDLPGHGATSIDDFSFAVRDINYLGPWLSQVNPPKPWIIVGHSMGTIAASYLANATQAKGLLLMAPSSPLEQASISAAKAFHPYLSHFVPDSSLHAGADLALSELNITDAQTDLRQLLKDWQQPTMILTAKADEVIGTDWAKQLQASLPFEFHQLPGKHAEILTPTTQSKALVLAWLQRLTLTDNTTAIPKTPIAFAPKTPASKAQ